MNNGLITKGKKIGVTIGNQMCFTYERALEVYKVFLEVCHKDFSVESCVVLSEIEMQLVKIGFDINFLEETENKYLESL